MAKKSINLKALTPCQLMNINGTNGLVLNYEYNESWASVHSTSGHATKIFSPTRFEIVFSGVV